jgi:hypothetical protein
MRCPLPRRPRHPRSEEEGCDSGIAQPLGFRYSPLVAPLIASAADKANGQEQRGQKTEGFREGEAAFHLRPGGLTGMRSLSLFGSSLLVVLSTTATAFAAPAGDATASTLAVSVTVIDRCAVDVPTPAPIGPSDVSIACGRRAHNQTALVTIQSSSTAPILAVDTSTLANTANESPAPENAGETTVVIVNF